MDTSLIAGAEAEAVKVGVKILLEKLWAGFASTPEIAKGESDDIQKRIAAHLTRVVHWASTYTFLGLGSPKECEGDTIALRFSATPRRYRNRGPSGKEEIAEEMLLEGTRPTIVLGEPGAGKTTTLRRIALRLLTQAPACNADRFQFPILILLREMAKERFLCEEIADLLGLPYDRTSRISSRAVEISGHQTPLSRSDFDIRVRGVIIEDAIAPILNSIGAVILMDGLDELPLSTRSFVDREIEGLSSRLDKGSIIVSCRSGDFGATLHGFRVVEISPLDDSEISAIAKIWLPDSAAFLEALRQTPYRDIVDRPLLLSFLLFLYSSEGQLPEQPSLIYRKVVYRLLRDWDEERRIQRVSRYAHFDPDRKIDFLSELAYELTYEIKGKAFDEKSFREPYERMYSSFRLPASDYEQVVREIQTHTGIIVSTGIDTFEFSHLSIQEFLTANYIARAPHPDLLKQYLAEYPAPVAVACALSSNPSAFFSEMMNRHMTDKFRNPHDALHGDPNEFQLALDLFGTNTAPALQSFLSRLRIENPFFKIDKRLGVSVLCLFAFYYRRYTKEVDSLLVDLLTRADLSSSVRLALQSLENIFPQALTRQTAVFNMDTWFQQTYESVAGSWLGKSDRTKRLPLVLLPASFLSSATSSKLVLNDVSPETRERVYLTLASSPFCLNEKGGHSFREDLCHVCGFIKQKMKAKKPTRR